MASDRRVSRRTFLKSSIAAGIAAATGAGCSSAETRELLNNGLDPWTGNPEVRSRLVVNDPEQIRLLQFTDVHFFRDDNPAIDRRTVDDLKRYVDHFAPDAVVFTGDFWHDNPGGRGAQYMAFAIEQAEALGVPWLFTWGNHDQLDDYTAGHAAMTNAKRSLYRGGPGGGCYTVALTDKGGAPVWDLVCLNSMDDGLKAPQHEWLRAEKTRREQDPGAKHAFAFCHIPLGQYDDIWENGAASGVKFEKVCSEGENGASLARIRALGTVQACFVGHDHVNDYGGLFDGVELVYGRATGHGGYGADKVPKGAKLIMASAGTGRYFWQSVYPDGSVWTPEPGKRINTWTEDLWARG